MEIWIFQLLENQNRYNATSSFLHRSKRPEQKNGCPPDTQQVPTPPALLASSTHPPGDLPLFLPLAWYEAGPIEDRLVMRRHHVSPGTSPDRCGLNTGPQEFGTSPEACVSNSAYTLIKQALLKPFRWYLLA